MADQPKRPEPKLARSDFESKTHEQLAAMLDEASTTGASALAAKLSKASSIITKIGDDLMQHVKELEWQGKAGDSFRDWGGQTASATLRLGNYAEAASRWMGTVSQAIAEAKAAMPAVSETTQAQTNLANAHKTITAAKQPGSHNDPDAQKLAQTARGDATSAQQRIDAVQGEAAQQMRRLAQTYEYSAAQVNSVQPPTFSPPQGKAGSSGWWVGDGERDYLPGDTTYSGGTDSGGTGSTGSSYRAQGSSSGSHTAGHVTSPTATAPTSYHSNGEHSQPSAPVSLGIDSTDTLSRTQPTPVSPAPTTPGAPRLEAPVPLPSQPTAIPPTFSNGSREIGTPPTRVPASSRLPQVLGRGLPTTGLPRESGIAGGRPVANTGRSGNSLPRGTVIGKENTQGRTPMGRGMMSGGPAGGTRSGSGLMGGRRLASETGGIVGGRSGLPGRGGGRPFTAGGSGLVRPPSNANEAVRGSSRSDRRKDSERPDYLVEDEETWAPGGRRPHPPVID